MKFFSILIVIVVVNAQEWQNSFNAGNYDINDNYLGGSEVLQLVSHKNKLFASVGYWQDELNIWYGGNNVNNGWSQIIRLDNSDEDWILDLSLDSYHLRPGVLKQVIFTKDMNGNFLANPDTLLITASYSSNFIFGPVTANAFIRDDQNQSWNMATIYEGNMSPSESYSIRDMQMYEDDITGEQKLFITVGTIGIFAGKYNPNLQQKIEWSQEPEFGPFNIRPLGIVIANDNLFLSSGNKIFKRNNGLNPSYSVVHDFSDLSSNINSAVGGIRGLSVINNNDTDSMILMWCPDGQSKGSIFRLDPNLNNGFDRVYETKVSLLVEDYLPGVTVNYLLGAYNEFYKVYDNVYNDYYHIVGFESTINNQNYLSWNGYYSGGLYAIRNSSGDYEINEISYDFSLNDNPLVATRCYVKSPFNNEDAIYFGGFDPNGFIATNKAWIYKKINTIYGDLNNDSVIDILDIVLIVNLVLLNEYNYTADLNEDEIINILDIVQMVNLIID